MFREMRRAKQQLSPQECLQVISKQTRAVLSVLGDEDYPYGIPINYYYDEETGHFYFHGSRTGHKLDSLKKHPKVSLCIFEQGQRLNDDWFYTVRSVIVFGKMKIVEEPSQAEWICRRLAERFVKDQAYIDREIEKHLATVQCLELLPEHMTGKQIRER